MPARTRTEILPLGAFLEERREVPLLDHILDGSIPIVAKVRFADGGIELRSTPDTRTDLIFARPGDLLVSGINALKGAIGLVPDSHTRGVAATIHYGAYRMDDQRAVPGYVVDYLRSGAFRRLAESELPNGIKTELKARRLLQIRVPLPDPHEQEKILTRLTLQRAGIRELQARRRDESAFILGRRVSVGADARRVFVARLAEFESSIRQQCELRTFGEALIDRLRHGVSHPTSVEGTGAPVLMRSATTGFILDMTKVEYLLEGAEVSELDFLHPGDIIFARGNKPEYVGASGLYDGDPGEFAYANLFMRVRVDTARHDPRFVQYWLMTSVVRDHVRKHTKGTAPTVQKINGTGVKSIPFPVGIPLSVQRWWIAHLDELRLVVDRLEELIQHQLAELEQLETKLVEETFSSW